MRDYSKVMPTFWSGETGKEIRKLAKTHGVEIWVTATYLMTCQHSNMLGLYQIPIIYMCHDTGMTEKQVESSLTDLVKIGFCKYDKETEMIWVVEMARHQIGHSLHPNDKQVKGVQKKYEQLPKCPFLADFFEKYQDSFHLNEKRNNSSNVRSPSEAPSEALRSQEQEQEQEQEQDIKDNPSKSSDSDTGPSSPCPLKKIALEYNRVCVTEGSAMKKVFNVDKINQTVTKQIQSRWREFAERRDFMWWTKYFEKVVASSFLTGRKTDFVADLEWITKPTNMRKILEGKYDDRKQPRAEKQVHSSRVSSAKHGGDSKVSEY